jgi:hypothetical protein
MPSLLRCTTNNDAMGVGVKAAVNNDDITVQHSRTGKDSIPSSTRLRQFGVVGGTVIFILLFNTLFLLVVIRLIAKNDDGIMTITHLFRGQSLPHSSQMMDLRNGSHQHYFNDRIIDAMDDAGAAAATTTENTLENPLIIPAPGPGVQQSDRKDISNDATINHDDTHKQGEKDTEVDINNNNDTIHPPVHCWVPFSYIIIGKCRRYAREGLPMPLADASSIPLI